MRIVHALGWYFPDSLGGTEVYVAALGRLLRERGHDVLIAAPDARRDTEYSYKHAGTEVFRYPIPANPTRSEAQGRVRVKGSDRFHSWIERTKPEIIHCHSLVTGLGLEELKVARSVGAGVVVTCHTPSLGFVCQRGTMMRWGKELCDGLAEPAKCASCVLQASGLPMPFSRLASQIPQTFSLLGAFLPGRIGTGIGMSAAIQRNLKRQKELLELADSFVVLTEWAFDVVARNMGSERKLVLNRLGIDRVPIRNENENHVRKGPPRFGYVGRFHETKGIFVLAEALAGLPSDLPFSLEFRGPMMSTEDRLVRDRLEQVLRGDTRVRFTPAVEHSEIARVLREYDVLLCPSTWLEGGPTVAMESQAVGTPVVGSRMGGLAEIVEDGRNGRLLPPGDAKALATAIVDIVRDPSVIQRWRRRLPAPRTMADVTTDYVTIYERSLRK
ncbi:MAG: glycosyltransferase [Vicinamibacteria bacterium]